MDIPIIDLSPLTTSKKDFSMNSDWKVVADNFRKALTSFGFTYIINHNISQHSIREAFQVSKEFFELSKDTKTKHFANPTQHYHGYNHRQMELNTGMQDMREIFDFCGVTRKYPSEVPAFGPVLERLESESKELLQLLLRLLARSLELEDTEYFCNCSKYLRDPSVPSSSTFRALYYRGIPTGMNVPLGTVRTKEHTDHGLITLLFQDNVGGLEIKTRSGSWIPAPPVDDSLLINTGDLLEFWTGGLIPATPHRVMIPEDRVKQSHSRQSLAYFVHPDDATLISPIKSSKISYENIFEPITSYEFAMKKMERTY